MTRPARVVVRAPAARDREPFLAMVRESRSHHRPWVKPPSTPKAFAAYLQRSRRDDFRGFLVCRREDGAIAGVFNLSQIFRGGFQNAYLGYYGAAATAGRGYMTEGMRLVLAEAFRGMKLHRVEANIQPGNRDSIRLARRCGFRREGFSPRYLKVAGRWRDHERWAITAEDFRGGRR